MTHKMVGKNLRNTIGAVLLTGIIAGITSSGCMHSTPQQVGDAVEYIWNAGDTEKRNRQKAIRKKTPQGYYVELYRGVSVYYHRQLFHIQELIPPYAELCWGKWKPMHECDKPLMVKIENLDMFRE